MRSLYGGNYQILVNCGLAAGTIAAILMVVWAISMQNIGHTVLALIILCALIVADIAVMLLPQEVQTNATERTLRMASVALENLKGGLTNENCQAICEQLLPETGAMAVAMTDTELVRGYAGEGASVFPKGSPIRTQATREVLASGKMKLFADLQAENPVVPEVPAGIVVPLIVRDKAVGALKFYFRSKREMDRAQLAIARGFGELLSTQLSADELDRQAELTAKAEVKALQAQINPHFLFNTLNTIAALTRSDPTQARDLLREFAAFYRATLENSESLIPLSRELEQTRRYLKFEHARFGESRILESEHIEEGCEDVMVPAFLVQPIVENAVRHAMRDDGPLRIEVHVATEGDDVLVSVIDDGLGMDDAVAAKLLSPAVAPERGNAKGTGIALRNVAERVERFYGHGSGIEIMSRPDEGTSVTVRLVDVAPER